MLGLEEGATLRAGIVDGPLGPARIERFLGPNELSLDCRELVERGEIPERPRVDLLIALPRPKVMKRLLAPLACLGVGRVVLTNAARVERYYFDSHVLAPGFVRERLLEGLGQARDTRLPEVSVHRSFRRLVEDELDSLANGARRLLADLAGDGAVPVRDALAHHEGARVLLAIGPEGGWDDFERALLAERGFRRVTLGSRVLRSDIACLVAVALAHEALDRRTSPT